MSGDPSWDETVPIAASSPATGPSWDETTPADEKPEPKWSDIPGNAMEGLRHTPETLAALGKNIFTPWPLKAIDAISATAAAKAKGGTPLDIAASAASPTGVGPYIGAVRDYGGNQLLQGDFQGAGKQAKREIIEHPIQTGVLAAPAVIGGAKALKGMAEDIGPALQSEAGEVTLGPGETATGGSAKPPLAERAVNAIFEPSEEASNISKAAGKGEPTLGESAQAKIISSIFGPSEEAIMARMKNPEAIQNYLSPAELSHELPKSMSKLSDAIGKAEGKAYETLGTTTEEGAGAIPKAQVLGIIQKVRQDMGDVITPEESRAASVLDNLQTSLVKKFGSDAAIPEIEMKDLLKKLNKAVNWDNPEAGAANDALKSVKGGLNEMLKTQNEAYADAMKPVEFLSKLHDDMLDQFSLRQAPGKGYVPTTATEGKLANVFSKNKSMTQETLNRLNSVTGNDYLTDIKNAKLGAQFEKGAMNGSRRVNLGTVAGGAIGSTIGVPWLGAAAGASMGAFVDAFGGPMAGKLVDFLGTPEGAAYQNAFKSAIAKGPQALAMTHYLLKANNPAYKQMTENL